MKTFPLDTVALKNAFAGAHFRWPGFKSAIARGVLAAAALALLAPTTATAWEYIGTESGVKTFRKEVAGSDVMAFRGETSANIHIAKVLSVFLDKAQRKHWVDRYADSKTIDSSTNMELYWIKFALPFPVSNRDYVLRADGFPDADARTYVAKIKSVSDKRKPDDDCCTRAMAYGTYYKFEAVPGFEKTKITVEVHTDPKGILPDWVINMIQKKWPTKTLSGLIARAQSAGSVLPEYAAWHQPPAPPAPPAPAAAPAPAPAAPAPAPAPAPAAKPKA